MKQQKIMKSKKKSMNYKYLILIIALVLIAILVPILIKNLTGKAIGEINYNNPEDPLGIGINPENIPQTPEDAKEISKEYLRKNWALLLQDSTHPLGKALWTANKALIALSPVFRLLIGMEYSFSWMFFLSLVIVITIMAIIYKTLKEALEFKSWVSLGIAVIVPALGVQTGFLQKILDYFSPTLTNFWIRTIFIFFLILILIIYSDIIKQIKIMRERAEKEETEERREQKSATAEKIHDIELRGARIR
jgi:predicted membrane protein